MMIPSRGYESCLGSVSLSEIKSKNSAIETKRFVEIGDLEMNVSNGDAWIDSPLR
jgi:hypothetical protein